MIKIYCCNIFHGRIDEYEDYSHNFSHKSNRSQWRYIKDINKVNGSIATYPHRESVLRKYFINPHLDENGYIKEFGKFSLKLNNFTIEYELVDK